MNLTPEQDAAARTVGRDVAVTAGPGSGKTRVLVEHYLEILDSGASADQIVAITFTRKAAAEMRDRLRREIGARAAQPGGDPWRRRRRQLESAVITTIHAFCARLLRGSPIEAGVDPRFILLDEYQASVLLESAAQKATSGLLHRQGEHDAELAAELVVSYGRAGLVRDLCALYQRVRGLGLELGALAAEHARLQTPGWSALLARLTAAVEVLRAVPRGRSGLGLAEQSYRRVARFLEQHDNAEPLLQGKPTTTAAPLVLAELDRLSRNLPVVQGRIRERIEAELADLSELLGKPAALKRAYLSECAEGYNEVLRATLVALDAAYNAEKAAAGALDFEDLELMARRLLASPGVAAHLANQYRYILVDEFQDTNGLQREIIDSLRGPGTHLFVVGDQKQSIYGFRGAEVEVFAETLEAIGDAGGLCQSLTANFRSDPRLVRFCNELFGRIMAAEPGLSEVELRRRGFVAHVPGVAQRAPLDPDRLVVELHLVGKDGADPRALEARNMAVRLRELVQGQTLVSGAVGSRALRYGDVAMLFRQTGNMKQFEAALARAGVPFQVVEGHGFYDRPEVIDLLNLLAFVSNQTDEIALAAVLRSPLFGLSDDGLLALRVDRLRRRAGQPGPRASRARLADAVWSCDANPYLCAPDADVLVKARRDLQELLKLRNRMSTSELLVEALRRTEYDTVAAHQPDGAQRRENIEKLVTLAARFDRAGTNLLRDFVAWVKQFRTDQAREAEARLTADQDAVWLLTVHKAKGLEFPVVVIPEMHARPRPSTDKMLVDRHYGVAIQIPDGRGGLVATEQFERLVEVRRARELYESMRLFYVAATRAMDLLIMSGSTRGGGGEWLNWTRKALDLDEGAANVSLGDVPIDLRWVLADSLVAGPPAEAVPAAELDELTIASVVDRVARGISGIEPPATPRRTTSATALQSWLNCPRQFYYARLMRIPESTPAPPSRQSELVQSGSLSASVLGIIIHRFCETWRPGSPVDLGLEAAIRDVRFLRRAGSRELAGELNLEAAIEELLPMANNYAGSELCARVEQLLEAERRSNSRFVHSEVPFGIELDHGVVVGAIDKVLLAPAEQSAQVVDFKTGYVPLGADQPALQAVEHRLQMQVYTLAVRRLFPEVERVEATLQFLRVGPDEAYQYPASVLEEEAARVAVDSVLEQIEAAGQDPARFEPRLTYRCRQCDFRSICPAVHT